MKKSSRQKGSGVKLNKKQRSTLEMWQDHLAALSRASEARVLQGSHTTADNSTQTLSGDYTIDNDNRPSSLI